MKALQHGIGLWLGLWAVACSGLGGDEVSHGVAGSRQLSQLNADEALAVCEVLATSNRSSLGKQVFDWQAEVCREVGLQYGQSKQDCATLAYECLSSEDTDMEFRSRLTYGVSGCAADDTGVPRELFPTCSARVADLEACARALWVHDAYAVTAGRCDDEMRVDLANVDYVPCSVDNCANPIPGCEALASACPELYCRLPWGRVGTSGSSSIEDSAFCQQ